jgi:sugar lactone lactonase YvrE
MMSTPGGVGTSVRGSTKKPRIDPVGWTPPPTDTAGWPAPRAPHVNVITLDDDSPEDVVVDRHGRVYTGAIGGNIIRLEPDGRSWQVVANTGGRPLGLEVIGDHLLICDSARGLLHMDLDSGRIDTIVDQVGGEQLTFCSNVVVTAATDGPDPRPLELYFTQSTTRYPYEMYMADIFEHSGAGRLLRVVLDDRAETSTTPWTGTAEVVLTDLQFANGLVVHQGRLLVAETGAYRIRSYDLASGADAVVLDGLPAFPDNSSLAPDGEHMWLALVADRNRALDALAGRPGLRKLLWKLPNRLLPKPVAPLRVLKIHLPTARVVAEYRVSVPGFGQSTGVIEHDGRLWVGGIEAPAVAWFDLD